MPVSIVDIFQVKYASVHGSWYIRNDRRHLAIVAPMLSRAERRAPLTTRPTKTFD